MKRRKLVDGRYVLTKKKLNRISKEDTLIEITPELVQELANTVKDKVKYFKKENKERNKQGLNSINFFAVHLSPDISFMVRY